jgi:hypothetical protein
MARRQKKAKPQPEQVNYAAMTGPEELVQRALSLAKNTSAKEVEPLVQDICQKYLGAGADTPLADRCEATLREYVYGGVPIAGAWASTDPNPTDGEPLGAT